MSRLKSFSLALVAVVFLGVGTVNADSAKELEKESGEALSKLYTDAEGSKDVVTKAAGVLVFPDVTKVGLGVGGESGKGVLQVKGETVGFYQTSAASIGLQAGMQSKSVVLVFTTEEALKKFQDSSGWEVGVDGAVSIIEVGTNGSIDTTKTMNDPVVGFVFGQKGIMADLSLKGAKISKIDIS